MGYRCARDPACVFPRARVFTFVSVPSLPPHTVRHAFLHGAGGFVPSCVFKNPGWWDKSFSGGSTPTRRYKIPVPGRAGCSSAAGKWLL